MSIVILGGGISGITAAYFLGQYGIDATVYEASPRVGGLLDNFTVEGFRFDQAVHVSFAKEPEVRAVFDQTDYYSHPATTWNWDHDLWLRHPVQNNLYPLSIEERVTLIEGLTNRPEIEVNNYRDWLIYQYGEPIAKRWPMIYTEKYWTVPAEQLGTQWIGDRMRRAQLKEVLLGAMTTETPNTYYLNEVRYPKQGGYRAFIEPMIKQVKTLPDKKAVKVSLKHQQVTFEDGEKVNFTKLISTMPLPRLIEIMDDVPADIRADAAALFATELDLISIGFSKPDVPKHLWFYIYDQDILASRAYSPSLKSPDNAPAGTSSMQFEIYSSRHRPMTHSVEELKANTLMALERMGIATSNDILFMHHRRMPYGNVVFDLGMEERRDRIQAWLSKTNIISAGRFGEWGYLWSNQSFMSGKNAADRVKATAIT